MKQRHPKAHNNQSIVQFYSTVVSGIVSGCIFSGLFPALLLPFTLLPFLYYLVLSRQIRTLRQHIFLTVTFFVSFQATVFLWFMQADINGLTGIPSRVATLASAFSLTVMTIVLSTVMIPMGIAVWWFKQNTHLYHKLYLVFIPAVWVISEYLRSVTFSVFLYGKGGSVGDYWNFGSLGLAVMQTPYAYLSQYVGMYGLSFLVVFLSLCLLNIYKKRKYYVALSLAVALVIIASFGLMQNTSTPVKEATRHASVQSNISRNDNYSNPIEIADQSSQLKDLIVLTEFSEIFKPQNKNTAKTFVSDRLSPNGVSIDVSGGSGPERIGTLEFRNTRGTITDSHTKRLLIPTGEYMPYTLAGVYKLIGQSQIISVFNQERSAIKGDPVRVHKTSDLTIGPVACSGILSRNDYRTLVRNGAEVLTNSASLSIFNRSSSYFNQSLAMARFHAIANQRTFIQASKDAPVFVIDQHGSFIVAPDTVATRFTDFSFQKNSSKTLYSRLGEWVLSFSVILVIASVLYVRLHSKNNKQKKPH